MTVISPTDDVVSHLKAPTHTDDPNFVAELRDKAGMIVGTVDSIVQAFTGFSPLSEWIAKPFGGDWDSFLRGAEAWTNCGKALNAVHANVNDLPDKIDDSWTGSTHDAFAAANKKIASAIKPFPHACDEMAKMCKALAQLAQTIVAAVVEIVTDLVEFIVQMVASLAVPVGGEAAMPVWITKLGIQLGKWVPSLVKMIEEFVAEVKELWPLIEELKKVFGEIIKIEAKLVELLASMDTQMKKMAQAEKSFTADLAT